MEELNNQIEGTEEDYLLPDDYEEEETTEEVEEEPTEAEPKEEVEQEDEAEEIPSEAETKLEDLEIKFMHDVKKISDIPADELKTYIQKGMNQERLQGKLNEAVEKNNNLDDIAKMFDMDTDKLMETLKQQYFDDKASKESRNVNDVKREYESERKSMQDKMIERFVERYPDVDVESIQETIDNAVSNGEDITGAYETSLKDAEIKSKSEEVKTLTAKVAELEKQMKVKKQNTKTKAKGVVGSVGGSDDVQDDFMAGLFG